MKTGKKYLLTPNRQYEISDCCAGRGFVSQEIVHCPGLRLRLDGLLVPLPLTAPATDVFGALGAGFVLGLTAGFAFF